VPAAGSHWGQLYNLLHRDQQLLAIGIDVGTALELTQARGSVVGSRTVATLDGRAGSVEPGGNGALGVRYVIFDSFVQGDTLVP
jgi:hypothetical protein